MSKRHSRFFILFFIGTLLLMTYQSRRGAFKPLGFLMQPMNLLSDSVWKVSTSVKGSIKKVTLDYGELEDMRNELKNLRLENQKLKEMELENARLRDLLSLGRRQEGYYMTAKVIGKGNDPWSNVLIIDKGGADFIRKDMTVTTVRGLVGKVHKVYDSYSSVLLIDDTRFKASARLQASRTEGVFAGTGARQGRLDYVGVAEPVKEGEVVVTSGLDGIFPPGLSIGYVLKTPKTGKKLFQDISVMPFADTKKLEEVIIIRQ